MSKTDNNRVEQAGEYAKQEATELSDKELINNMMKLLELISPATAANPNEYTRKYGDFNERFAEVERENQRRGFLLSDDESLETKYDE